MFEYILRELSLVMWGKKIQGVLVDNETDFYRINVMACGHVLKNPIGKKIEVVT